MVWVRSIAFMIVFYLWSGTLAILMTPLLICPRRWTALAFKFWGRTVRGLLALICGVRVEIRGREHIPQGPGLIAGKHQCMFDTIGLYDHIPDVCYVAKKELRLIPWYGWYLMKSGMLEVDRDGAASALKKMLRDAHVRLTEVRQILIFPEGTRQDPGSEPAYKPGVAALYRDLELPCTPMATNSGVHWPAHGFLRHPGTIVYEFRPPIPAGLKRAEFMRTLQETIETHSAALTPL